MNTHDLLAAEKSILQQIHLDELVIGDRIPSVRSLQARLFLSRSAVLAAVASLRDQGVIRKGASTRQGYVLAQKPALPPEGPAAPQEVTVQYLLPFTTWNYTLNKYLASFESIFSKHGINLVFSNTHNSVEEEGRLLETIYAKPATTRPDYLFLTTCNSLSNTNIQTLEKLGQELPVILIDRYFPNRSFHYIGVCNAYIGCHTARYLIEKGHRRIAYIKAYNSLSTVRDRFIHFKSTLEDAGIPLDPESLFLISNRDVGSIADIQSEVDSIGSQILSLSVRPTAVVCSFDRIGVALMQFFLKNNVRVPEDICVVGCDNDVDVGTMSPLSLSTFRHPYKECAREAIERIQLIARHPEAPPRSMEFYSEWIKGDSTE